MEKYITTEQIKAIVENAPKGVDKAKLIDTIAAKGYTIQGFNEPVPEKTLLQKTGEVAGSIINAPERLGGGILNLAGRGINAASEALGGQANPNLAPQAQRTGLFGNTVDTLGYKDGKALQGSELAKDVAGNVAQNASFLIPGGTTFKGAALGTKVLRGVGAGAATGGLQGAGLALQDQQDASGVIGSTLKGAAIGGALGGAIPLTGEAMKLPGKAYNAFQNKINPTVEKTIEDRVGTIQKVTDSKATLRNYLSKTSEKGFDPIKDISSTDLLQGAVDNTGTIRTKTTGGAIEQYNEFLKPQEGIINKIIKNEGQTIPLQNVEEIMIDAVNNSPIKGSAKSTAMDAVRKEIEGLKLDAIDGNIPVSVLHEAKVNKYAHINYMNAESGTADKLVAKTLKQLVEDNSSAHVKELNQELARHYANIGFLEKLDGAKVEGGKLGKHFAKVIGGMVGSHFGPLGTIAGSEVAGKLSGASMASTLSKGIGKELQSSKTMNDAVGKMALVESLAKSLGNKAEYINGNSYAEREALLKNVITPQLEKLPKLKADEVIIYHNSPTRTVESGSSVATTPEQMWQYADENTVVKVVKKKDLKSTGIPEKDAFGERVLK